MADVVPGEVEIYRWDDGWSVSRILSEEAYNEPFIRIWFTRHLNVDRDPWFQNRKKGFWKQMGRLSEGVDGALSVFLLRAPDTKPWSLIVWSIPPAPHSARAILNRDYERVEDPDARAHLLEFLFGYLSPEEDPVPRSKRGHSWGALFLPLPKSDDHFDYFYGSSVWRRYIDDLDRYQDLGALDRRRSPWALEDELQKLRGRLMVSARHIVERLPFMGPTPWRQQGMRRGARLIIDKGLEKPFFIRERTDDNTVAWRHNSLDLGELWLQFRLSPSGRQVNWTVTLWPSRRDGSYYQDRAYHQVGYSERDPLEAFEKARFFIRKSQFDDLLDSEMAEPGTPLIDLGMWEALEVVPPLIDKRSTFIEYLRSTGQLEQSS